MYFKLQIYHFYCSWIQYVLFLSKALIKIWSPDFTVVVVMLEKWPVDFFLQVLLCKDYLQYVQKQGLQNCSLNQFG